MDQYAIPVIEASGATPVEEFTADDTGLATQAVPKWAARRNIEIVISGGSTRLLFSRSATVAIDPAATAGDEDYAPLYTPGTYGAYIPQGVTKFAARADTGQTATIRMRPIEEPNS